MYPEVQEAVPWVSGHHMGRRRKILCRKDQLHKNLSFNVQDWQQRA